VSERVGVARVNMCKLCVDHCFRLMTY